MTTENPESKRRAGGGKLARSETVTVRLDPKLRYLAELAALKQRRTVSSFIEWAIEATLSRENIRESEDGNFYTSFTDAGAQLWDVDDADRFAKLALNYPELLTHEEQKRWKLIRENGAVWRGSFLGQNGDWAWKVQESSLIFQKLRDHWLIFVAVAAGELDRSHLPTWVKTGPAPKVTMAGLSDIPF